MESKICVIFNTEKSIDNFWNKNREGKQCDKRSLYVTMRMKINYQISEKYIMKKKQRCVTCKV